MPRFALRSSTALVSTLGLITQWTGNPPSRLPPMTHTGKIRFLLALPRIRHSGGTKPCKGQERVRYGQFPCATLPCDHRAL